MGTVLLRQPCEWFCMNLCGLLVTRLEVDLGGSHCLHVVHADRTLSTPATRVRILQILPPLVSLLLSAVWGGLRCCLIEVLISIFLLTKKQRTFPCDPCSSNVSKSFLPGCFLLKFIQRMADRHWCAVPVLFLSRALAGVPRCKALGGEGLLALR